MSFDSRSSNLFRGIEHRISSILPTRKKELLCLRYKDHLRLNILIRYVRTITDIDTRSTLPNLILVVGIEACGLG